MKLKLDENLGQRGREICAAAGHDVSTVAEQNLTSAPDPKVIAVCASEGRCLVTLDLDFANPLRFPPKDHAGIAVLRLPKRPVAQDLLDADACLVRMSELWREAPVFTLDSDFRVDRRNKRQSLPLICP